MKRISIFIVMILVIGYQSISICIAQDYTKWHLPEGAISRLGKGIINEITFSPDSSKFAVSTTIGVWIYNAENGKELALLKSDELEVESSLFTPDGKSLIVAAVNGETYLWNVTTGEKLSRLTDGNDIVDKVALSDDSTKFVTYSKDSKYRIYDLKNPKTDPLVIDDTIRFVNKLDFSTDGEIIAATKTPLHSHTGRAVENFRLQVWNTYTKNLLINIPGEAPYITALKLLPDGNTLVTADVDKQIQLWDIAAGSVQHTFKVSEVGITLAYAPKSKILAIGNEDINLWEISSNGKQATLNTTLKGHKYSLLASEFSPDENTLVTASIDGVIIAWDVQMGNQLFNVSGHIGRTQQLAFAETDDKLLTANSRLSPWIGWDTEIHYWDLTTHDIVSTDTLEFTITKAISPDCRTVIVEKKNGDIDFLNIRSKERQFSIVGFEKGELSPNFTYSSDGKVIATNDKEGKIHLWKIADIKQTSKPWKTISISKERGWMRALSADGHTLAFVKIGRIVDLWDVIADDYILTLYDLPRTTDDTQVITGLSFSPDGKTIVSGNQELIHFWDTKTGDETALCIPDRSTSNINFLFTPDNSILISACGGALLNFAIGELRTADGSYTTQFISENYGGTFQLWDVKTGELLSTHAGHTHKINALCLSKDGKVLATGGEDGTILLWDWEKISAMR